MENPKRYADKIKRKDETNQSGLGIPSGSYNMMESVSIIKPLFQPHFKSIHSNSAPVHPKQEVSQPGDASEVQADELADSVMEGGTEQSQGILSESTSEVSRSGEGDTIQTSDAFDQQLQNTKGHGQKLDEATRSELEAHTGTDLSGVNIHTDEQAQQLSRSIGALAFTHGMDIYFNKGNYNPHSEEGKSLLAHEVAHVVQGEGGIQTKIMRQIDPIPQQSTNTTWTISVSTFSGIPEGDPDKHGMRLGILEMYNAIDLPDGKLDALANSWGWTTFFEAKPMLSSFNMVYTTGLFIGGLREIYSEYSHIRDLLDKYSSTVFNPQQDDLNKLAEICELMSQISNENFETFKSIWDAQRVYQPFDEFIDDTVGLLDSLRELSNITSIDKRVELFHDEMVGSAHYLKMLILLSGLTPDDADKFKKKYSKRYGSDLLSDITQNFGVIDLEPEYEMYKRLHSLTQVQKEGFSPAKSEPYITASPETYVIAEGQPLTFKFIPGQLASHDLTYHWFVNFDPEGILLFELENRGKDPGGLHLSSTTTEYHVYFFVPGRHEVVCRLLDRTQNKIFHYVYTIEVKSTFQIIGDRAEGDLNAQGDITFDLFVGLVRLNSARMKALEKKAISDTTLDLFNQANQIVTRQAVNVAKGTTETLETAPVIKYFENVQTLIKPADKTTHSRFGSHTTNKYELVSTEITSYISSVKSATTIDQWKNVIDLFYTVTKAMDLFIADKLEEIGEKEASEELKGLSSFTHKLRKLTSDHPGIKKVKAVFYPKEYAKDEASKDLGPTDILGIPFNLYIWYDSDTKEWVLEDLADPSKFKSNRQSGTADSIPHFQLFQQLDSRLRFPEGVLLYQLPDMTVGTVYTHANKSVADWLAEIALALGLITLAIATAGASVPFTLIALGAAFTIGAAAFRMAELSEHGMLGSKEVMLSVLDIASAVIPVGGAIAGKLLFSNAIKSGNILRLSQAKQWFILPAAVGLGLDSISLVVMASDAWEDYKKLSDKSQGDSAQNNFAMMQLFSSFIFNGALLLFSVRSGFNDISGSLKSGKDFYIDVDFSNEPVARPLVTAEDLLNMGIAAGMNSGDGSYKHLSNILKSTKLSGDLKMRTYTDLFSVLTAKNVDADSRARILESMDTKLNTQKSTTEAYEGALAELRYINRLNFEGAVAQGSTVFAGVKKGQKITLKKGLVIDISPVHEADILYLRTDGKVYLEEVKRAPRTMLDKMRKTPEQLANMKQWKNADVANREIGIKMENNEGMNYLFSTIDKNATKTVASEIANNNVDIFVSGRKISWQDMTKIRDNYNSKGLTGQAKADFLNGINTVDDMYKNLFY